MRVAFSGHRECRDCLAISDSLSAIADEFPGAECAHGGAAGFDSLVARVAGSLEAPQAVYLPDYQSHGRAAPLIRNRQILAGADLLVCYHDGRAAGGTAYTVRLAQKQGIPVRNIYTACAQTTASTTPVCPAD